MFNEKHASVSGAEEYDQIRQIWNKGGCSFVAIDVESGEQGDATDVIELGSSVIQRHDPAEKTTSWTQTTQHRLLYEYLGMSNGKFVPDNRGRFLFGETSTFFNADGPIVDDKKKRLPLVRMNNDSVSWELGSVWPNKTKIDSVPEVAYELDSTIRRLSEKGTVYIVFHDYSSDLKILKHLGVSTAGWTSAWDTQSKKFAAALGDDEEIDEPSFFSKGDTSSNPIVVVDTRRLCAALENRSLKNGVNLGRMTASLTNLGTRPTNSFVNGLHNAANDAHYTLVCLAVMASGPSIAAHRLKIQERLDELGRIRQEGIDAIKAKKEAWKTRKSAEPKRRKTEENGWDFQHEGQAGSESEEPPVPRTSRMEESHNGEHRQSQMERMKSLEIQVASLTAQVASLTAAVLSNVALAQVQASLAPPKVVEPEPKSKPREERSKPQDWHRNHAESEDESTEERWQEHPKSRQDDGSDWGCKAKPDTKPFDSGFKTKAHDFHDTFKTKPYSKPSSSDFTALISLMQRTSHSWPAHKILNSKCAEDFRKERKAQNGSRGWERKSGENTWLLPRGRGS